ncbi:MAG: response regulator [Bacteroidia bacterium]
MQMINLAYIVDDDEILVMLMQMLLKRNPHYQESLTFQHGQDALDALSDAITNRTELPQVIFLDLNMPLMDGWQFLEEFKLLAIPREIPVYVVTSSIDPSDIETAKKYPSVKGYIEKPVSDIKLNEIYGQLMKK